MDGIPYPEDALREGWMFGNVDCEPNVEPLSDNMGLPHMYP